MHDIQAFPYGFPLHELPELTEEVLFAWHFQIKKLIYVNAAFEKVWNISRTNIGSELNKLVESVHKDDKELIKKAYDEMLMERKNQKIDFRIVLEEDRIKWIRLHAYVSSKANHEIIVGVARDISDEKSYNETLHKFADRKNSILQILSHDLLGPLSTIQLSSYLLEEKNKVTADDSVKKLLKSISSSSKRSVAMIRDLVNSEFLESSESAFLKHRVDIVEKIRVIIEQFRKSPESRLMQGLEFTTSADCIFIQVDESKFLQAINNLINNALKFTPEDGEIEVSISEPNEETLLITIRDTGIGIPEDLQPYLFEKFTRARRSGLNGEQPVGLGMSIIKTIVEWHHGRIWFESKEGKGSTFYVEIPKGN